MIRFSLVIFCSLVLCHQAFAVESSFKGLVDVRAVTVSSGNDTYLVGDYGKFRYSDGEQLALDLLGLQYHAKFDNDLSFNLIANGYADDNDSAFGITEAFIKYKGLPSENGWRWQGKAGIYYPKISIENTSTAWSTPHTLTSSVINNWVGEELRSTGVNVKLEKLGKFNSSKNNFAIDVDLFVNNESAGAILTWHGWTLGSRQTLLGETLILPDIPALDGMLSAQAHQSDPFIELDDKVGINLVGEWHYDKTLKMHLGYYNNNAEKGLVEHGQYTWTTYFIHSGLKYAFAPSWEVSAQYMAGNTLMTSPPITVVDDNDDSGAYSSTRTYRISVVDNDFASMFLMIKKQWREHQIALRLEQFEVDDLDQIEGDNNNETGDAFTFTYRYKMNRQMFMLAEYNIVDSQRWSRSYHSQPMNLTEEQYQFSVRYYF